jgi:zinc/manganese transport system permease protein
MWDVIFWPLAASVLLPGILIYLGIHVVRREIIFIDLALAQIASLGTCAALLFDQELNSPATYWISLASTLLGAAIFSMIKTRKGLIPLEAIIGIAYVMAAAGAVLILSRAPEGNEQIKNMLVGNILLVTPAEVWKTFGLFAVVGVIHWVFRRQFLMISLEPEKAAASGIQIRWWDFLFYALFGLVVTSFVRIAGVLLIFTYLIVPAVCGILLCRHFKAQFAAGYLIALAAGIGGIFLSFWADLPTGAAMVCTFGALLIAVAFVSLGWNRVRQ